MLNVTPGKYMFTLHALPTYWRSFLPLDLLNTGWNSVFKRTPSRNWWTQQSQCKICNC